MLILEVCSSSNFRSVWHKLWFKFGVASKEKLITFTRQKYHYREPMVSSQVYRYFWRAMNVSRRSSSRTECRKWRSCQDSLVLCHDPYLPAYVFAEGSTKIKIIFCSQCSRRRQRYDQDHCCAAITSVAVSTNDFLLSIYVLLLASYFRMFSCFFDSAIKFRYPPITNYYSSV